MTENLFAGKKTVHFVGIGGSGMRGVATVLAAAGHRVSGSDMADGQAILDLRGAGITVTIGHDAANLPEDPDLLVISAAVRESNTEVAEARNRGIPVVKYALALGSLMAGRRGIAVAGAHGKTSTTGLLAFTLTRLGADPTYIMGGEIGSLGGSSRVGRGQDLVAEACEYDRSFLHLRPEVAIVTNIDEDHLDYYSGIAEITEAFRDFARLLPPDGLLIALNELTEAFGPDAGIGCPVEFVGIREEADWVARDVDFSGGVTSYTAARDGEEIVRVTVRLAGYHSVLNSLMVLAATTRLGHEPQEAAVAMRAFPGVRRRMELKFRRAGITVFDDYAHHPAEIRATLKAIRATHPGARIWCVFQPHQASRTRFLLREFAAALSDADRVLVPDIFFARDSEEEKRRISSRDLVKKVMNLGTRARYVPDFSTLGELLIERLRPRDVLVTMGAGNIFEVAEAVAERLEGYGSKSIPA